MLYGEFLISFFSEWKTIDSWLLRSLPTDTGKRTSIRRSFAFTGTRLRDRSPSLQKIMRLPQ